MPFVNASAGYPRTTLFNTVLSDDRPIAGPSSSRASTSVAASGSTGSHRVGGASRGGGRGRKRKRSDNVMGLTSPKRVALQPEEEVEVEEQEHEEEEDVEQGDIVNNDYRHRRSLGASPSSETESDDEMMGHISGAGLPLPPSLFHSPISQPVITSTSARSSIPPFTLDLASASASFTSTVSTATAVPVPGPVPAATFPASSPPPAPASAPPTAAATEFLSDYTCPICFAPPTNPTLTPCGHICCGLCLFTAVKTTLHRCAMALTGEPNVARCPVCRAAIPGWDGRGGGVIGLKPRVVISL
ncbi:hypothetical protein AX17_002780 [Amanita inopinata Kibby_2008]|nr:hypothetical protein AX17_002780 [Amanita inopinata Kibby_2008]